MCWKRIVLLTWFFVVFVLGGCGDESPRVMSSGAEGFSPDTVVERFAMDQVRTGATKQANVPLDILWVIDNSGSMGQYQEQVKTNTQSFMQQFSAANGSLDWKMGLISTSLNDSPYGGFTPTTLITSAQSDRVTRFQNAVADLGTNGDSREREFDPMKKAFSSYPDFLRQGSLFVVIFLTDAREQSDQSASDFLSYVKTLRGGSLDNVAAYGVLGDLDLGCSSADPDFENYNGSKFQQVIQATKGAVYPLCKDFASNLLSIAKSAVTKSYTAKVKLQSKPIASSITITYKGDTVSSQFWQYDSATNTILFPSVDFWTDESVDIEVSYQLAPVTG